MTQPLYELTSVRHIEAEALAAGLPLMERAGKSAADFIQQHWPQARRIVLLIGCGNNGGDGLVCARHLQAAGLHAECIALGAEANFANTDLIVDALFGIGLSRDLTAPASDLIQQANQSGKPIFALDTPSGLDAFSGAVRGAATRATKTLTFIADKPGLHTGQGKDHAGDVYLDALGLSHLPASPLALVKQVPDCLQKLQRRADTHKGLYGTVAIYGGASGMQGAALLAGRAALKLGAGKVRLGFVAADFPPLDLLQPELMLQAATSTWALGDATHLAIGPGLGCDDAAINLLEQLLCSALPLVLDADALNLIAQHRYLQTQLKQRRAPSVLTPHPSEAARLLGCSTAAIQAKRLAAAQQLAQEFNAVVLLKGAGSVVCDGSQTTIIASGNAALSNAGQGDVLTGILVALLAQGLNAWEATLGAAWLHGAAADEWVKTHPAKIGLSASEVIDAARHLLNQLYVCDSY